jgi:hypothetical protein
MNTDLNKENTKVETITRHFCTLKQAERFLNRLYDKYESVRCVRSPLFSEEGYYYYEVQA